MPVRDHLSFQLYSLRNFPPLDRQLGMLKTLGYANVEPFGGLYDQLDSLGRALKDTGLTARSGHFALAHVEDETQRTLDIARRLEMDTVIVPYIQPQDRPIDRAGWETLGRRLAKAAEHMGSAGLRLAYHNHDFEFRPLPDGSLPIEHLLVDKVLWEADLAWIAKAGADPKPWLARFTGRVPFVHVKDIAPAGEKGDEDGWADVGHGTLNWQDLWQASPAAGAEVMIAEHDNPNDGERFARNSAEAMRAYDKRAADVVARIGLVGCGNISDIYLTNAARFRDFTFVACADVKEEAAAKQAAAYGIAKRGVDELLGSPDVDIVLNLTIPEAHAPVSLAALDAGKHVYTEKPLATTLADGERIVDQAKHKGLRVGSSPDTVLGAAIQEARRSLDSGAIGRPLLGVAAVLSHGMEHWHPNPAFFFRPGGGPVFDIGPYYLSTLVTLLGPVGSVSASGQKGFSERTVTTESSPFKGTAVPVETPTTLQALLDFENGVQISFLASWDVWNHGMRPLELHGTEGSMRIPDPNWFGGDLSTAIGRDAWETTSTADRIYGRPNHPESEPLHANYRGLGLADMARGIADERPHRANGDVALHVLAVMEAILQAAESRATIKIRRSCERPAALDEIEAASLLA